jgi:hypothetical protein
MSFVAFGLACPIHGSVAQFQLGTLLHDSKTPLLRVAGFEDEDSLPDVAPAVASSRLYD